MGLGVVNQAMENCFMVFPRHDKKSSFLICNKQILVLWKYERYVKIY